MAVDHSDHREGVCPPCTLMRHECEMIIHSTRHFLDTHDCAEDVAIMEHRLAGKPFWTDAEQRSLDSAKAELEEMCETVKAYKHFPAYPWW